MVPSAAAINTPPPSASRATWATVTTLKERPEVVQNFVAHHLYLGASEIILYFDDPDDAAIELVKDLPRVKAIPCDTTHWAGLGQRSARHQARQKANAQHAYGQTEAEWIIHIDADELISGDENIGEVLARSEHSILRLPPYETLFYDKAGRAGRRDHYFRGVLPNTAQGKRIAAAAYGPFESTLFSGMLSHSAGKYFVRTGQPGLSLSIHAPYEDNKRRAHPDAPGLKLLHFHGGDYAHWRERVDYRLSRGAYMGMYQANRDAPEETLHARLSQLRKEEGEAGLKRFYRAVCTFGKEKGILRRVGALHRENLWLDAKRAEVFGTPHRLSTLSQGVAGLEADVLWHDITMRVVPDNNFTECMIARGEEVEAEELAEIRKLVTGKKVKFYDIGANAGIYSLTVAKHAAKSSQIYAYEPNPEMQRRLSRNIALNGFKNITLRPIALGMARGKSVLNLSSFSNLGQASIASEGTGIEVEVGCLTSELRPAKSYSLTVMKIDVEGAEAMVLRPALAAQGVHWPDIIMMEHKSADDWGVDLFAALAEHGYSPRVTTTHNTFLYRERD